jgi:hypothetical protein
MSVSITLKNTMARSTDAALNLVHHRLIIAAVLLALGLINVFYFHGSRIAAADAPDTIPTVAVSVESKKEPIEAAIPAVVLSKRMQGALDYVTRRYRVSQEALLPVFETAQMAGRARQIDPLLIVAIIGIESGFNPFAESSVGAQGLMQIMPRFHMDKVPAGAGNRPFFDPVINIKVGVSVLEEAIRRAGGLVPGLQYYAGSTDPESGYAGKVLAEKQRLEQAAARSTGSNA